MNTWVSSTKLSRSFRSGFAFQAVDLRWQDWCGGGPLDNVTEGV